MPTLGTYEVELQDGYVVSARDSSGSAWASDTPSQTDSAAATDAAVAELVNELRSDLAPATRRAPRLAVVRGRIGGALRGRSRGTSTPASPFPRLFSHALVLGAVLVPMSFTVAHAETAPVNPEQRITVPLSTDTASALKTAPTLDALHASAAAAAQAPPPAPVAAADAPAAAPAPATRPFASTQPAAGSGGRFPWGYCTWYVSTKRFVPWLGNAIDWWPNARAMGFQEGMTPRVGAIMVTRESSVGHVAYVESVDGNGGFTISEMNFKGFGIVDQRSFASNPSSLVGFIY